MFTVWFGDGPTPDDTALAGPLAQLQSPTVGHCDSCSWVLAGHSSTAHDPVTGVRSWAWSRLDNADELRGQLTLPGGSDAGLLLAGYLRWGVNLPNHLTGDFSVCIYDPRERAIHCFRDPIGVRPLTLAHSGGTTVVTTAPGVLWRLPGFTATPDERTIIEHATQIRDLSMSAAHPQAHRVTPGCVITRRDSATSEVRYHRFDPQSPWLSTPAERWVRDFREVLDAAVAARIPSSGPIGVEFSGGLDSVGIATLIRDVDPRNIDRLRAYGFVFFTEEEATIRMAADTLGITRVELGIAREGRAREIAVESLLGEPVAHEISLRFTSALNQCAESGGTVMFAGHGGDQAVSHFAHQAPHEWWTRAKVMGGVRYALPRRGWRQIAGDVKRAVRGARFTHRAQLPSSAQLAHTLHLRPDALESAGVIEQLTEAYRPLDAPSVNADIVTAEGIVRPVTAEYWSRRAEECNTVASLFGMTYAFPLLDATVIQQFLVTPTVHKYRNGLGRYLFREALGPSMPESVRWAPTKYLGPLIPRQQTPRIAPDSVSIHPLLADLMPAGASLPPKSNDWGNPYGVHRVNMWLHDHFPAA